MGVAKDLRLCRSTYYIDSIQFSNNTLLNCNGSVIFGNGTGYGAYVYIKENVTIKNCNFTNFTYGAEFVESRIINLTGNQFYANYGEDLFLSGQTDTSIKAGSLNSFKISNQSNASYFDTGGYIFNITQAGSSTGNITSNLLFFNSTGGVVNVDLFGLTDALIYFSNKSVACSDVPNCDGAFNITFGANNHSKILNYFNFTEGINRYESPLWASNSSQDYLNKFLYLSSNLSQPINASVIAYLITRSCYDAASASYTSNLSVSASPYNWSCYDGNTFKILLNIREIEPATINDKGNKLQITFITGSPGGGGGFASIVGDVIAPPSASLLSDATGDNDIGNLTRAIFTTSPKDWNSATAIYFIIFIFVVGGVIAGILNLRRR